MQACHEIASLPPDAPAQSILALPYLKNVVTETMRLYGGISSLPRIVPAGGAALGGYFFPPGITISSQSFTLHRNPVVYEDPERYVPYQCRHWQTDVPIPVDFGPSDGIVLHQS